MNRPREDALQIWNAGVDSVRARSLVERCLQIDGDELIIDGHSWLRSDFDRLLVVGAGKAATAMAEGVVHVVQDWLPVSGWINVPQGTEASIPGIDVHVARPAGINEPTEAGVEGTRRILDLVAGATQRDLCLALISGGGSALLPAPIDGVTLEDKLEMTRRLSGGGADITELNTVRKRLSRVKGGGLLAASRAGQMVTLILSDVLGDPVDLIASGPTVVDPSSDQEALDVLAKYDPERSLPQRIYDRLSHPTEPVRKTEILCPCENLVIGNNAVAVDESGIVAESLGYNHAMQSARQCEGPAEEVGYHLAQMVIEMLRSESGDQRINCLITGGEPTVELAPENIRGRGGRNQQLVLAAYEHLLEAELTDDEWARIALLSGGTDGEDGPTDAAGAVICQSVHHKASELGLDVEDHLSRNDAYTFFEKTGGLCITGPTGTNVCDVRVALVSPDSQVDH